MPQMYPISWVSLYCYTLFSLVLVVILVSYLFKVSVMSDKMSINYEISNWEW